MSDELVDIIDDEGRTVAVVPRGRMRRERLPHRCVYLLVFNRARELFIHQRTATKDVYPSYWDVCAGGVLQAGESFEEAALREGQEELGVAIDPQRLFPFRYADERTIVQGMVYRVDHDGPFRLQTEEIAQGLFVNGPELNQRISESVFCPDGLMALAEAVRQKVVYLAGLFQE